MGCGESKHAVATADAVLQRKKSNASTVNGGKDAEAVAANGSKTTDEAVAATDAKVAPEKKTQTEQRDEKKIDKAESDGVVAEIKNVPTEAAKADEREEKEISGDGEKEKKEIDNGGGNDQGIKAVEEKPLAEETAAEKENGETGSIKEEIQVKNEEATPLVEETKSSTTSGEVKNVKNGEENAADLTVKDSTEEEKK